MSNTNSQDYYPPSTSSGQRFGAPMHERSGSNGGEEYRYGFNGMESIDEMVSAENGYDFGARMYDGRLGRWWSVDPVGGIQPQWSDYKGFLDNPIIYIDPEGNTEYLTIIIKDQSGHSISLKVKVSENVMTDGEHHHIKTYLFGVPYGEKVVTKWYDFERVLEYTIDENGKLISSSLSSPRIMKENGVKDEDLVFTVGDPDKYGDIKDPDGFNETVDVQNSGFELTTNGETISPTKTIAKLGGETINIDDFLNAITGLCKNPNSLPDLKTLLGPAEAISTFQSIVQNCNEFKSNTKLSTEAREKKASYGGDTLVIYYHGSRLNEDKSAEIQSMRAPAYGSSADTTNKCYKGNPNEKIDHVDKRK